MAERKRNIDNLKKGKATQFNGETAAEAGRKGAAVANAKRREQKQIKETIKLMLNLSLKSGDVKGIEDLNSLTDISGANLTVQDAIVAKQIELAMKGNVKSAEFILAHLGEAEQKHDDDKVVIVDDY